jgi:hypothetical protein
MNLDIKFDKKLILDVYLLIISLTALFLLYTSLEYEILELQEWMFSLDWYWYLIIMVLAGIKPLYTLYTMTKKK